MLTTEAKPFFFGLLQQLFGGNRRRGYYDNDYHGSGNFYRPTPALGFSGFGGGGFEGGGGHHGGHHHHHGGGFGGGSFGGGVEGGGGHHHG